MAAKNTDNPEELAITPGDRKLLEEIAAGVAELRGVLAEFRPLLDAYRSTNGGTVGLLRAGRRSRRG